MTTQEKLIKRKLSILELAEYLKNVSQACKINGVSRQHFYDIKKTYDEHGIAGLKEKSRRKPCNRIWMNIWIGITMSAPTRVNVVKGGLPWRRSCKARNCIPRKTLKKWRHQCKRHQQTL